MTLKVLFMVIVLVYTTNVRAAPRLPRLTLAEPSYNYYNYKRGHAGTYIFGYDVSDPKSNNIQYRNEERYPNGTVIGSYGYVDPLGESHRYRYMADEKGYRVTNEMPRKFEKNNFNNVPNDSTESIVSWTRPRKPNKNKKKQTKSHISNTLMNKQKYFDLKPPSYYAIN